MAAKGQQGNRDITVTTDDPANGTVIKQTPFEGMLRAMIQEATAESESRQFTGDNLNAILAAETEDALWEADERGPLNGQHLAGCELQLIDVSVKFSRGNAEIATPFKYDGKKMYLMVTAVRISDSGDKKAIIRLPEIGEVFQFNTSAQFLATKIWAFYVRGYIDADSGKRLECVIKEIDLGDETAVLKLRPIPRRAVPTQTV